MSYRPRIREPLSPQSLLQVRHRVRTELASDFQHHEWRRRMLVACDTAKNGSRQRLIRARYSSEVGPLVPVTLHRAVEEARVVKRYEPHRSSRTGEEVSIKAVVGQQSPQSLNISLGWVRYGGQCIYFA